jgi:hypothetical protein
MGRDSMPNRRTYQSSFLAGENLGNEGNLKMVCFDLCPERALVAQFGFNNTALSGPQAQGPSVLLAS